MIKHKKSGLEAFWDDWGVALIAITLPVLIGLVAVPFVTSNSGSEGAANQRDKVISSAISDINNDLTELASSSRSMVQAIKEQCLWLTDNISDEVGDYCIDAGLESYRELSASPDRISEYDYITLQKDEPLDEVLREVVETGNSLYDERLAMANETASSMEEQCGWLEDNINSTVADYCNETISDFLGNGFSESPFDETNYLP